MRIPCATAARGTVTRPDATLTQVNLSAPRSKTRVRATEKNTGVVTLRRQAVGGPKDIRGDVD